MTQYQKLVDNESLPQYNDTRDPESQYIPYTPEGVERETRTYQRELNRCCVAISVLNFLCCWWCGIPALIFAILGLDAEKKGDTLTARAHGYRMRIFNLLGYCTLVIAITLYAIRLMVWYATYENPIHVYTIPTIASNTWTWTTASSIWTWTTPYP